PLAGCLHATVQIDGADDRLGGVRQDGFTAEAAALELTRAKPQVLTQFEPLGQLRQGHSLHQSGTQTRQLALPGLGEALEERLRRDEVENRVAQKLQALVIAPTQAAVGQRQDQQILIPETVSYLPFQSV